MSDTVKQSTWDQQGYNEFLSNGIPSDPNYTNAYDFNTNIQDGSVTTSKVAYLAADKIVTGILYSTDQKTYFDLDGKQIIINDGSNDRVLLGYLAGGF